MQIFNKDRLKNLILKILFDKLDSKLNKNIISILLKIKETQKTPPLYAISLVYKGYTYYINKNISDNVRNPNNFSMLLPPEFEDKMESINNLRIAQKVKKIKVNTQLNNILSNCNSYLEFNYIIPKNLLNLLKLTYTPAQPLNILNYKSDNLYNLHKFSDLIDEILVDHLLLKNIL